MKKFLVILFSFLALSLFLSRCIILKMRLSDEKAKKVFVKKHVPIQFFDTVISGHHIHYVVSGLDTLPTLVFIHGSPGSWLHYIKYMWDSTLCTRFRMVGIDRPGYGYSDFGKAMHLQDQCRLLLPVLQGLKNGRPFFGMGHSYGGPVVAKLAADDPGLFNTIIIAAGSIDPDLEKKETWRHIMEVKPLAWFLPGAFKPSNTEILYLKKDLYPLAADLPKVRCHVQFVHGDEDTWVPIENVAYGMKMMTNAASLHSDTVKGVAHQIPWKRRTEFKNILLGLK